MKTCSSCQTILPDNARFCHKCGAKVEEPRHEAGAPGPEDIAASFFTLLGEVVAEEQDASDMDRYLRRFRDSDFQRTFDIRMEQLAGEVKALSGKAALAYLNPRLEDLCDYFLIHFCKDINRIFIPEAVLQYQLTDVSRPDPFRMIMDFLHFESEPETVYANLLQMPVDKLRNAGNSFLTPRKDEPIYFICDLSLLGNCKEGFAMTDRALYWKAPLEKARKIPYSDILEVKKEKDWLSINGLFFHASETLNVRMLKLLRKLISNPNIP